MKKAIKMTFFTSGIIFFVFSILYNFYPADWIFWLNIISLLGFVLLYIFNFTAIVNKKYMAAFVYIVIPIPLLFKWLMG